MQNPHVKYLKSKNGIFYLIYHEQGTLFLRGYENNAWSAPQTLAEHTGAIFSLCQYGEECHLLYASLEGNLILATSTDLNNWEHRPFMNGTPSSGKTKYFILPHQDSFHMIYHQPTESTGVDSLVYTVFRDGQWEKPYQIDRFMPFGKTPYFARRLSQEHIVLYYRTAKNAWSAREMLLSPYTMGSLTPLIQTPANCIDLSIVNDAERIHILYIVRGMFRTQVVYQYKQTNSISAPRILWEDVNCNNCLVYLEQGKVVLMWTVNSLPMRAVSENNGVSFGTAERLTDPFPAQCFKGEFIGAEDASLNAAETYGDSTKGFFPSIIPLPIMPISQAAKLPQPMMHKGVPFATITENHKQQVNELTALLAQRGDEISTVNARWKAKTSRLEEELQQQKNENARLKQALSAPPVASPE